MPVSINDDLIRVVMIEFSEKSLILKSYTSDNDFR